MLCLCIVLSFPADTEEQKRQPFSFSAILPPFCFGLAAEFSPLFSLRGSHGALLPCFREHPGSRGEEASQYLIGIFPFLKSMCDHFENEIPPPPFPTWQSFLQIADIPSEVFAC